MNYTHLQFIQSKVAPFYIQINQKQKVSLEKKEWNILFEIATLWKEKKSPIHPENISQEVSSSMIHTINKKVITNNNTSEREPQILIAIQDNHFILNVHPEKIQLFTYIKKIENTEQENTPPHSPSQTSNSPFESLRKFLKWSMKPSVNIISALLLIVLYIIYKYFK